MPEFTPVDPAACKQFETGAVRSKDAEGVSYHLITPIGLRAVAQAYREGEIKYSAYNCEKGFPAHDLLNHAIKHLYTFLEGDRSEPHLGHAAWNVLMAIHSLELWPHLNAGHLRGPGCVPPVANNAKPDPSDAVHIGRSYAGGCGYLCGAENPPRAYHPGEAEFAARVLNLRGFDVCPDCLEVFCTPRGAEALIDCEK